MGSPFSLKGRSAVVTGGGRGIGAAVARGLAEAGADVCIGFRTREDAAEQVRRACAAFGVKASTCAADLTSPTGARHLVDQAVQRFGALDICVHSAGIWPVDDAPVSLLAEERWAATMRQNVDAMFFVAKAAVAAMVASRPVVAARAGRLVFVSSTAGQRGEAGHADYAASKGAMISFVKSMAVEVASEAITVNAVAPGWVDTDMCEAPFRDGGRDRISAAIPVGRIATPEDIAFPTVCLCLSGARHVTGEIVNVNGGSVLCG